MDKFVYRLHHLDYQLLGSCISALRQAIEQPLPTKLQMFLVHGLGHAIGIEQQSGTWRQQAFLCLECEVIDDSQRQIGFYIEPLRLAICHQDGSVVAGIAITQTSSGQVKHPDEQGHKHVTFVVSAARLVEGPHDLRWVAGMLGACEEDGLRDRHHQR